MSRVEGAVGGTAASVSVPVAWTFMGYSYPAGSMIVGLLACFMVRLFITLDTPGPKRWLVDGIITAIAMLFTAVWIAEYKVDLFAALGTGGSLGALGNGIIALLKRRGQSTIDALEALTGKGAVPPDQIALLRKMDARHEDRPAGE